MKRVNRIDVQTLTDLPKLEVTPNGFLSGPVRITRTGVFDYGDHKELRPIDEVSANDSLASLARIPVTNLHPGVLLTPRNAREHTVGLIGDAAVIDDDGEHVLSTLTVIEDKSISEIDSGEKREVSAGYTADLDDTPGVYKGQHYDSVQRNIRYNHVALVPKGRAGRRARVIMDAEGNQCWDLDESKSTKEDGNMIIKLNGRTWQVSTGLKSAFEGEMASRLTAKKKKEGKDDVTLTDEEGLACYIDVSQKASYKTDADVDGNKALEQIAEANTRADEAAAEAEGLKGKLDVTTKELAKLKDPKHVDEQVTARAAMISKAKPLLDDKYDFAGKSEMEIIKDALKAQDEKFDAKDKKDEYLKGMFDMLTEEGKTDEDDAANRALGKKIVKKDKGGKDTGPTFQERLDAAQKKTLDRWKPKTKETATA